MNIITEIAKVENISIEEINNGNIYIKISSIEELEKLTIILINNNIKVYAVKSDAMVIHELYSYDHFILIIRHRCCEVLLFAGGNHKIVDAEDLKEWRIKYGYNRSLKDI